MERRLVERSLKDDAFRQELLGDLKAAVEEELGTRLPEEVRVVAVEKTADTAYLVLPSVRLRPRRPASSPTGNSRRCQNGRPAPILTCILPKPAAGAKRAYLVRFSTKPAASRPGHRR